MTNTAYEPMLAKLQRLPEPLVQEVDAFIDFLQMRFESQSTVWHAQWQTPSEPPALNAPTEEGEEGEEGMDTYLRDLEAYEERLATGKIAWQ